jgi:hypothetical protein
MTELEILQLDNEKSKKMKAIYESALIVAEKEGVYNINNTNPLYKEIFEETKKNIELVKKENLTEFENNQIQDKEANFYLTYTTKNDTPPKPIYNYNDFEKGLLYMTINPNKKEIFEALGIDWRDDPENDPYIKIRPLDTTAGDNEYIDEIIKKGILRQLKNKKEGELISHVESELTNLEYTDLRGEHQLCEICEEAFKTLNNDYPNMTDFEKPDDLYNYVCDNNYYTFDFDSDIRERNIPLILSLNSEKIEGYFPQEETPYNIEYFKLANYLIQGQGYSDKDFNETLVNNQRDKFLQSVREELRNMSSGSNYMSFFVELEYKDLPRLYNKICNPKDPNYEDVKYITLEAGTTCGFYDPWNGGGSLLNITLQQLMSIPLEHIHSIAPDGYLGYKVADIYGDFPDTREANVSSEPVPIQKVIHETQPIQNIELFMKTTNDYLSESLRNESSVLLQSTEKIDYSIDSATGKAFNGINQLVAQQFRKEHNFDNSNFTVYKDSFKIKKDETALIINEYNQKDNTNIQKMYYNHDQIVNPPVSYYPSKQRNLDKINFSCDTKNRYEEILTKNIFNYYKSIYGGGEYHPNVDLTLYNKEIANEIKTNNLSIIKCAAKANNIITDHIEKQNINKFLGNDKRLKQGVKL